MNATTPIYKKSRDELFSLVERHEKTILKRIRQKRTYKMPSGYISWEDFSAIIALGIHDTTVAAQSERNPYKVAQYTQSYNLTKWYAFNAPLYCLTKSMLDALDGTNIDDKELFANWQPALPMFVVTLPKETLFSDQGAEIDFIVVRVIQDGKEKDCPCEFPAGTSALIQITTLDKESINWHEVVQITDGGVIAGYGRNDMDDHLRSFTDRLRKIALNLLLLFQHKPELITPVSERETVTEASRGFITAARGFASTSTVLLPRWIGKQYQVIRKSIRESCTGKSPTPHIRRGHWRSLEAIEGKRWKQNALIWVQPAFVNFSEPPSIDPRN